MVVFVIEVGCVNGMRNDGIDRVVDVRIIMLTKTTPTDD